MANKDITVRDLMKPEHKLQLLLIKETKKDGRIGREDFIDLALEELEGDYSTEESLKKSIKRWLKQFEAKGYITIEDETIRIGDVSPSLKLIESGRVVSMNVLTAELAIWCGIFLVALFSFDLRLILLASFGLLLTAIAYLTYQKKYILPR
jgi:hypothetical protein